MSDDDKNEIILALAKLDPKNDDHWTETGNPRLDALGFTKPPLRADVTAAAPLFTRANPTVELPKAPELAVTLEQTVKAIETADQAAYEALSRECAEAEAELANAKALAKKALEFSQALEVKRDAALKKVEKARPKNENQLGIQAVLRRSQETRANKAGLAAELKRVGVTAALLQPGSRLDAAMARKRGFGMNRPNMNAKVVA